MKRSDLIMTAIFSFVFGIFGALTITKTVLKYVYPCTVDVTALVSEFVALQAQGNKTPEQLKNLSMGFSQALEAQLNQLSKTEHLMILPKEAILAGGHDITPRIRQALSAYLMTEKDDHDEK